MRAVAMAIWAWSIGRRPTGTNTATAPFSLPPRLCTHSSRNTDNHHQHRARFERRRNRSQRVRERNYFRVEPEVTGAPKPTCRSSRVSYLSFPVCRDRDFFFSLYSYSPIAREKEAGRTIFSTRNNI